MKKASTLIAILALITLLGFSISVSAGDLQPPAAPAPTMKTLDEIEPRIPIPASAAPVAVFVIGASGSYYLTGDRIASANGIEVNADNVTINLMGYSVTGPGSGTNYGIYMNGRTNVEIRNGTVRDFGRDGIYENSSSGKEHRIIGVRAVSNGITGIYLKGNGHLVKNCTAADNAYHGIFATNNGSTITGNTAYNNQINGIYADDGSTVTGNTAYDNQGYGIAVGYGCTVTGNTAYNNRGTGIIANSGSTVTGNTARSNNQHNFTNSAGIWVGSDCLVKGNTLDDNLQYNIYVYWSDNAIEENLVTDCNPGTGIYFREVGNFYANNRASGNGTDYAGNVPAPGSPGDGGGNASF